MKKTLLAISLLVSPVLAKPNQTNQPDQPAQEVRKPKKIIQGHVFAWPFTKAEKMQPRGGTTRGAEVTLDTAISQQWKDLQDSSLSKFEKDRRAILAMAGSFRVSFDFVETMGFTTGYKPPKPYFSWGTEHVQVIKNKGKSISLQHTLVMYFKDKDGVEHGPMVMKHWRQDWNYEDDNLHVYQGKSTWKQVMKNREETRGKWTQAVFQVDDSPRYEVIGEWSHLGGISTWYSNPCWRPLPRREFSVRNDYHVLQGTHEITLTPNGWVHTQSNQKVSLVDEQQPTIVAQELGINRYERITSPSLQPAEETWQKTWKYWEEVRKTWEEIYNKNQSFTLKSKVDGKKLYQYHFGYAASLEKQKGDLDLKKAKVHAQQTIYKFLLKDGEGEENGKY